MLGRIAASATTLALLAPPAAAQVSVGFSASAVVDVSVGVVVAPPAPVVVQAAPVVVRTAPPPVIVVRPVSPAPVVVQPPPSVVIVRPVESVPVEDDDTADLLAFGRYRDVFGSGELGGMDFALRILLGDHLSFETRFGYLAGGTEAGGNFEEAPIDFSVLWYPWDRDFPVYFGAGAGLAWGSKWDESLADPLDPLGNRGASRDILYVGTRAVIGAEVELFDFLLLAAETEFFYRTTAEGYSTDAGAGFSFDLGLGVRI